MRPELYALLWQYPFRVSGMSQSARSTNLKSTVSSARHQRMCRCRNFFDMGPAFLQWQTYPAGPTLSARWQQYAPRVKCSFHVLERRPYRVVHWLLEDDRNPVEPKSTALSRLNLLFGQSHLCFRHMPCYVVELALLWALRGSWCSALPVQAIPPYSHLALFLTFSSYRLWKVFHVPSGFVIGRLALGYEHAEPFMLVFFCGNQNTTGDCCHDTTDTLLSVKIDVWQ